MFKEEKNTDRKYSMFIDIDEFQKRILDCITSKEVDKYFDCTVFAEKPECKQAMIHGMLIASMMTSQCEKLFVGRNKK